MEKIIKVEFERETETALFCWVTYKVSKWFKKDVEVTELRSLKKYNSGNYSSCVYSCKNIYYDINLDELMIASKKGVVLTGK